MAKRKKKELLPGEADHISARQVIQLLASRHDKDVFVPECKDGPTHFTGHFRMDAWAMAKSWAHPLVTGYEVKISHSDFMRDEKWRAYLDLCNEFYFVAPTGIITPEEVPEPAGLILVSKTGNRLFKKRPAAYRDVKIPEEVFRYILMVRTKITRSQYTYMSPKTREEHAAYWLDWVKRRQQMKDIGHDAALIIHRKVTQQVGTMETENMRLKKLMESYDDMKEQIQAVGMDPDDSWGWTLRQKLKAFTEKVPPHLIHHIKNVEDSLARLRKELGDEDGQEEAS